MENLMVINNNDIDTVLDGIDAGFTPDEMINQFGKESISEPTPPKTPNTFSVTIKHSFDTYTQYGKKYTEYGPVYIYNEVSKCRPTLEDYKVYRENWFQYDVFYAATKEQANSILKSLWLDKEKEAKENYYNNELN